MTHVTHWSEDELLDYFWAVVRDDGDRLMLLRQLSDVALERASEWDMQSVRSGVNGVTRTLMADACFACLNAERRLYWHHIILVKHGGSNTPRNLIPVCHRCHGLIHPWLPEPTSLENKYGWTKVGDWAVNILQKIAALWPKEKS